MVLNHLSFFHIIRPAKEKHMVQRPDRKGREDLKKKQRVK